jgi:hypothetical protein
MAGFTHVKQEELHQDHLSQIQSETIAMAAEAPGTYLIFVLRCPCALAQGARDASAAQGARNASACSRDVRSERSSQRIAMITKIFFTAKDFYLIGAKNFRDHVSDQ